MAATGASNPVQNPRVGTPVEHSEPILIQPRVKWLQRIGSSPSLRQFGRRRAISNPGSSASMSCASLASAGSPRPDSSYGSPLSIGGYSTAPTTPGIDTPGFDGIKGKLAIRGASGAVTAGHTTPTLLYGSSMSGFSQASGLSGIAEDYFSRQVAKVPAFKRRRNFDFWKDMPPEIKLSIFAYLKPKELVQASIVCKDFYKSAFDGQLWTYVDASDFYMSIPADSLAKIIVAAGPFVKDLNLRGCVQVEHYKRAEVVVKACKNLINATLEGCRNLRTSTLHNLLKSNERLAHLNLTGLPMVTNASCKIIAQSCPQLESFNVSWCSHMDARGVQAVIVNCPKLKDLRAGEIRGFNDIGLAQIIFEANGLERLILSGCSDLDDAALHTMLTGTDPEVDILTEIPTVPVRRLRHLDLSRCTRLSSTGVQRLAHLVPDLEGLQLNGCNALTDHALIDVLATTPRLTHLDLEEISELTDSFLSENLAKAPCAPILQHLSISYCENLGDEGLLPVFRACTSLRSVDMDNTRVSDMALIEAAKMVRTRSSQTASPHTRPRTGLRLVLFDCMNVTWTGIREVLTRNSEVQKPSLSSEQQPQQSAPATSYPIEVIALKCFYGWQPTVDEHMKRVLRGDLPAAARLERKWTDYMMANEEAGVGGVGGRRRRRRARDARAEHADEEEGGIGMGGVGRRRRTRGTACAVM